MRMDFNKKIRLTLKFKRKNIEYLSDRHDPHLTSVTIFKAKFDCA